MRARRTVGVCDVVAVHGTVSGVPSRKRSYNHTLCWKWCTLQNSRCFRNATVRLAPLTAIVGPNASGKTALLHAITGNVGPDPRDCHHAG